MRNRSAIYAVALFGLLAMLASATMLCRELVLLGAGRASVGEALFELALGIGAGWFWLGVAGMAAWLLTERWLRPDERSLAARKAYLYLGQAAALAAMAGQAVILIAGLMGGGPSAQALSRGAGIVIALLFWAFLRRTVLLDEDFGREHGAGTAWRRADFYLAATAGLVLTAAGVTALVEAFIAAGAGAQLTGQLPFAAAAALVGGLMLAFALGQANRLAAVAGDAETNALSRKLFLYPGSAAGALAALIGLFALARAGLCQLVRAPAPPGISSPAAFALMVVGGIIWIGLEMFIRSDLARTAEDPTAAGVRRYARYGMAAVTLAAFLFGFAELLSLILGIAFGLGTTNATTMTESRARFALAAALALVNAPAWWGFWWSQQSRMHAPDREERQAAARRIYLYAILLIAAIAFFFGLGMSILGVIAGRGLANVATWAPITAVALLCMLGHLWVLRSDERAIAGAALGPRHYAREALPSVPGASQPPIIAVIDGRDGTLGARLLSALSVTLPEAVLWPIGLNATAQEVMRHALGGTLPAVPPDAPARATLIMGPGDMLIPGGLGGDVSAGFAAALSASPARKLLLPPRDRAFRWVAAPDWPDDRWIENAVAEAGSVVAANRSVGACRAG